MPGSDELHGGPGNDILNGDGGADKLWGDSGADVFEFDAPYTVKDAVGADMVITSGNDIVMDFNFTEGDHLDLNGQAYTSQDTLTGIVITTQSSQITLWQIHGTLDSNWIVT